MKPEQQVIADWMRRTMEDTGLSANAWAKAARKAPTTITRAVDGSSEHVTSIPTLHLLASKAGVPSVLDFLSGSLPPTPAPKLSAETLAPVLSELLPLIGVRAPSASDVQLLAEAVVYGLGLLPIRHSSQPSEDAIETAARGAVARFHDLSERS